MLIAEVKLTSCLLCKKVYHDIEDFNRHNCVILPGGVKQVSLQYVLKVFFPYFNLHNE